MNDTNITRDELTGCSECGQCDVDLYEVDGRLLCAECLERLGYRLCNECGEWHHDDEFVTVNAGWRRNNYELCRSCLDAAIERDSVFHCDDCDEYYDYESVDSSTTHNGMLICEFCRCDHWFYCARCDNLFEEDEVVWDDEAEEYYCRDCYDRMNRRRSIHDYGFKPYPIFHNRLNDPLGPDALTFGFELEVDRGSDRYECAEKIADAFGDDVLYMKNDGSVDFEIVTHPHTLKAYLEAFDFDKLCKIPLDFGYSSHNAGTCGFHIHVGREQLGGSSYDRNQVITRIVLLMYRHWNSLVKFSRRTSQQLDHWAKAPRLRFRPNTIRYDVGEISSVVRDQYLSDYDRYKALNLCNDSTIEFRLWRGSLKPVTLKATLQLTSNICRFAKEHSLVDCIKSSWGDLVNFETCPELEAYISELNLADGMEPVEIPYLNDLPTPSNVVPGFPVGSRVKITDSNSLVSPYMLDVTGTVRAIRVRDFSGEIQIAVEVDDGFRIHPMVLLHNCDGAVPSRRGYWVNPETIERIDNVDFPVGSTVRVIRTSGTSVVEGTLGTVVVNEFGDRYVGLSIPGVRGGHNLDGRLSADYPLDSGWWVLRDAIELVDDVAQMRNDASSLRSRTYTIHLSPESYDF